MVLLAGCSVVAPPPATPAHDLAQAKPEGTTSISLVAGWAFGVWMDDGFGGALRVGHQVDARSELSVDLLVGKRRGWSRAAAASAATNRYQDCLVRDRQRPGHPTIFSFPCKRREVEAEPGLLLGARGWWRRSPRERVEARDARAGHIAKVASDQRERMDGRWLQARLRQGSTDLPMGNGSSG